MSTMDPPTWKPVDLGGTRKRLAEVKRLLEQAAAVGLAQDVARIEAIVELENTRTGASDARKGRRRYR